MSAGVTEEAMMSNSGRSHVLCTQWGMPYSTRLSLIQGGVMWFVCVYVCESEFPVKRNSLSSNPQHTSIAVSQNQTTQGFDNPPCQDVQDADYYRTGYCYFVTQHQTKSNECVFKSSRSLYSFSSCEQIELVLFLPAKVEGQTPGVA